MLTLKTETDANFSIGSFWVGRGEADVGGQIHPMLAVLHKADVYRFFVSGVQGTPSNALKDLR